MVEPAPTASKIDCIEKGKMGNRKMFHLAEIEVTFQPANRKLREDTIVWCVWCGGYLDITITIVDNVPFPPFRKVKNRQQMVGYKADADPHHSYPNPHQNDANLRPLVNRSSAVPF
jgi:hypothetical protein